uniref:protein-ribulosamine 3-kinase n=1 Tax=Rhizophora mucronata TaxID=61149 RepID=A0A2P2LB70_RHIMU
MVMGPIGSIHSCCFPSSFPRFCFPKRKPLAVLAAMSEDPIREWIMSEGKATQITRISSVGGGCINLANRYDTDAGSFFVKTNRSIGPAMFEGEALGLGAMYETRTIRVPRPFKVGTLPSGGSYIIMEFIEFGSSRGNQVRMGNFRIDLDDKTFVIQFLDCVSILRLP